MKFSLRNISLLHRETRFHFELGCLLICLVSHAFRCIAASSLFSISFRAHSEWIKFMRLKHLQTYATQIQPIVSSQTPEGILPLPAFEADSLLQRKRWEALATKLRHSTWLEMQAETLLAFLWLNTPKRRRRWRATTKCHFRFSDFFV